MKPLLFLTALIGLAACDTGVESRKEVVPPAEQPAPLAAVAPLAASGPAAVLAPEADGALQEAAGVVDEATTTIGDRTRRVIVGWPIAADGSAPAEVTLTPAQ